MSSPGDRSPVTPTAKTLTSAIAARTVRAASARSTGSSAMQPEIESAACGMNVRQTGGGREHDGSRELRSQSGQPSDGSAAVCDVPNKDQDVPILVREYLGIHADRDDEVAIVFDLGDVNEDIDLSPPETSPPLELIDDR